MFRGRGTVVVKEEHRTCEPTMIAEVWKGAALILAAPDLRDALEDLICLASAAMSQANRDGGEYDVDEELREARAALAKAKGETP